MPRFLVPRDTNEAKHLVNWMLNRQMGFTVEEGIIPVFDKPGVTQLVSILVADYVANAVEAEFPNIRKE